MGKTLREWLDEHERTVSWLMRETKIAWTTAVNAAKGRTVSDATAATIRKHTAPDVVLGWRERDGDEAA